MYGKQTIQLSEKLAKKRVLLVATPQHPLRHVEVGPDGQVYGTEFINSRAPKIVATMKLFKDVIMPTLNTTIEKVMDRVKQVKMDLNSQDMMLRYKSSKVYEALTRQEVVAPRNDAEFRELTFKDMKPTDVSAFEPFGNGIVRTMGTLTTERTEHIYKTYIKSMNKLTCKDILATDASADLVSDRMDTILVALRIYHNDIVGSVFTPDKPGAGDALYDNIKVLMSVQASFESLYASDGDIIGSIYKGKISLFPNGDEHIGAHDEAMRGLALSYTGLFTVKDLNSKGYLGIYRNHIAIKAIQNRAKITEARREIMYQAIDELGELGDDFTEHMDKGAINDAKSYIKKDYTGSDLVDVRKTFLNIFTNILFWRLPFKTFTTSVNKLLKEDNNLNMESAVVIATAELIVKDIMVGIKAYHLGE